MNHRTSVSALVGASVSDAQGSVFGHIKELAVLPVVDTIHVHGMIIRRLSAGRSELPTLVALTGLEMSSEGDIRLRKTAEFVSLSTDEDYLLLERDLLDQQIIDINGHKVVRVNDVDLVWEFSQDGATELLLRIAEVEVGLRGAVRRLLKGLPAGTVDRIAQRFRPSVIPWNFVDLIDRDPARRVKLKIEQDKLARMHPSDLADILEELAPAERQALFISLDEEVAAEALEEVTPKMQQTLIESLDSDQVAGIVEEMDPGAAADLLSELSDERSEAILQGMDPEERQEVEELLEFSGDSAAGRMTTEYLALPQGSSVADAIAALHKYEGDVDAVNEIYLLDPEDRIVALIPLAQLVLAGAEAFLDDLPHGHIVSCNVDANGRKVAELFDKYNLRALPVLDYEKKLVGVVHADQVIALLRANR
ncbi:CBS domain-containing protein [Granulicella sp. dw_53]|uniref:magnesium transporter MgtE N-terminal domain-containing protein n=1 Tax=Granulicella sp. dw_53 TaxID=2719792 RepID=UPI002105E70A|nr:CBS domain-containing protein [Granulicella sp. dw_53]